jgi:hypothetical protein
MICLDLRHFPKIQSRFHFPETTPAHPAALSSEILIRRAIVAVENPEYFLSD